ncbi:hypothetical protein FB645_004002 [Coemansia sp. IMI 203386]|nr:hypothetical protein FB645_004002 [Coemansia sp. IMI 203386]
MSTPSFRLGTTHSTANNSNNEMSSPANRRSMTRGRATTSSSNSTPNSGTSGRRRTRLGRAIFHRDKNSAAFPTLNNSTQPAATPWRSTDEETFAEKVGRSSSCCEPRGFMKRPSCSSDYFEATVGSRAINGDARVPLFRTHSMDEISVMQNAGMAPVSEPMAVYYTKMARLSPAPSEKDGQGMVSAHWVPAPDPLFLRRLGNKDNGSGPAENVDGVEDEDAVVPPGPGLGCLEPVDTVAAAAEVSAEPQQVLPGRLSRLTRRLVEGLPFASASAGGVADEPDPSLRPMVLVPPEDSVSTFAPDSPQLPESPASPEHPKPRQQHQQAVARRMSGLMSKRMGAGTVRLAARRNSSVLTIPTAAKALPPFLPNIFALASTSPACTSFQHAEVVTANTAVVPPSLHRQPVSAGYLNSAGAAEALGSPVEAVVSTTPVTATAAHGMLCRLAKTKAGASHAPKPLLQLPTAASAMPDMHDEWARFVSQCMATEAARHMDDSMAVPDVENNVWFAGLDESGAARLHALVCSGVPAEYRRQVWMECAGALTLPVCEGYQCAAIEAIELDLVRTEENPPLSACLRRVLYGYALANPVIGYCQGMDKIVYGLLRAGLSSSDSLALLHSLLDRILPSDLFTAPMSRVLDDQRVLETLVSKRLPRISRHLLNIGSVSLAPVTVSWFLALMVGCLPEPHLMRVWDVVFLRGYPAIFDASLAILELMQEEILCCWSATAVYELMQNVRQYMDVVDVDEFGHLAFCNKGTRVCMSEIDAIRLKTG